jgi:putative ABC transport system ATP-binding protein
MEKKVLELRNICKSFRDGKESRQILKNVSLEVAQGEFVAIMGPSGCGKSTLLNIAGMMLSADGGSLLINGEDMSERKRREWTKIRRNHMGFIFQNHQLMPYLRGEEQLFVTGRPDRKDADELMKLLGIYDIRKQYPAQMSGGERQRFAIARAFIGNPDIILADEPTAALDSKRGRDVVEMIATQVHQRNKAAVMVTHDSRVIEFADVVYRMEDGNLINN